MVQIGKKIVGLLQSNAKISMKELEEAERVGKLLLKFTMHMFL